jgi:hypothetical protein
MAGAQLGFTHRLQVTLMVNSPRELLAKPSRLTTPAEASKPTMSECFSRSPASAVRDSYLPSRRKPDPASAVLRSKPLRPLMPPAVRTSATRRGHIGDGLGLPVICALPSQNACGASGRAVGLPEAIGKELRVSAGERCASCSPSTLPPGGPVTRWRQGWPVAGLVREGGSASRRSVRCLPARDRPTLTRR